MGRAGRWAEARGERARVEVDLRIEEVGAAREASEGVEAEELTPLLRAERVTGGGLKVSLVGVDWRDERRGVAILGVLSWADEGETSRRR